MALHFQPRAAQSIGISRWMGVSNVSPSVWSPLALASKYLAPSAITSAFSSSALTGYFRERVLSPMTGWAAANSSGRPQQHCSPSDIQV